MATQARGGFGTIIYRQDGSTWTSVGEVRDVSGPALSAVIEDATNMESPNGWAERVAVGVKEAGEVTFAMNLVADNSLQTALRSDLNAGTARSWRIVFPGGGRRISFTGFVSNLGPAMPVRAS